MFIYIMNDLIVSAGGNKQHAGPSNAVKLDNETEELKHEKLDLQVGKIIQQARTAKGMTQVELARVSIHHLISLTNRSLQIEVYIF